MKDEKTQLDCRLNTLENEKKFDSIKYEQIESERQLLRNEITKNEQIQPVIEKLQVQNSISISMMIFLLDFIRH